MCSSKCPLNTHFDSLSILKVGLNLGIYGSGKKAEQRLVGVGRAKARQAIFFDEPKTMLYRIVF